MRVSQPSASGLLTQSSWCLDPGAARSKAECGGASARLTCAAARPMRGTRARARAWPCARRGPARALGVCRRRRTLTPQARRGAGQGGRGRAQQAHAAVRAAHRQRQHVGAAVPRRARYGRGSRRRWAGRAGRHLAGMGVGRQARPRECRHPAARCLHRANLPRRSAGPARLRWAARRRGPRRGPDRCPCSRDAPP